MFSVRESGAFGNYWIWITTWENYGIWITNWSLDADVEHLLKLSRDSTSSWSNALLRKMLGPCDGKRHANDWENIKEARNVNATCDDGSNVWKPLLSI